ncbi:hypothetical protein [Peribacillus simplex]|uniref:Uncharacterized protein n=1 Tax=Peribacillus simplex TaxID=1478 RepID=A0AAW7I6W5_9BACI|nr:hypothetical protein [Peribacillus simplex]MDM5450841.1 hypothetical protein [Peribacillus simplex]
MQAQMLSQDVANRACVPMVVIIGEAPMMEVSLFPALTGCKVSMEMTVEGYQMKMQFKNMGEKQPVNARMA